MPKLSSETRNKIIEDLKNNVNFKEIMNTYNVSRATVFRIKKENNNEKVDETVNNDTENNDNETSNNDNETENNEIETSNNDNETENNFNIELFKKELNETLDNDNETVINNVSLISNNNSVISKKSVLFKKPLIIKPLINDKSNILDTIKNCNIATDIEELKDIRHHIIIIKLYINTFEKDLKPIYGNNKYLFEKKLFTLPLHQLKVILEDIRVSVNLKSNKSSFLTLSLSLIKGIETVSIYSGYDVSGLEELLMNDEDFVMDLQILSCELDISKYMNPKSSCFLKLIKKMYMLNNLNKMKKTINNINENPNLLEKIKNLELKK